MSWDNTPLTLEQARVSASDECAGVVLAHIGEDSTILALGDYTDEQVIAALHALDVDAPEDGTLTKGWTHLRPHSIACADDAATWDDEETGKPWECEGGCIEYAWWYDGLSPVDDDDQPVAAGAIPVTEWSL